MNVRTRGGCRRESRAGAETTGRPSVRRGFSVGWSDGAATARRGEDADETPWDLDLITRETMALANDVAVSMGLCFVHASASAGRRNRKNCSRGNGAA